jgi:hypothetical protein
MNFVVLAGVLLGALLGVLLPIAEQVQVAFRAGVTDGSSKVFERNC